MAARLFLARLILRSGGGVSRALPVGAGGGGGIHGRVAVVGQVGRNFTSAQPTVVGEKDVLLQFINRLCWLTVVVGASGVSYFHVKLPANYRREEAELNKVIEDGRQKIKSLRALMRMQ